MDLVNCGSISLRIMHCGYLDTSSYLKEHKILELWPARPVSCWSLKRPSCAWLYWLECKELWYLQVVSIWTPARPNLHLYPVTCSSLYFTFSSCLALSALLARRKELETFYLPIKDKLSASVSLMAKRVFWYISALKIQCSYLSFLSSSMEKKSWTTHHFEKCSNYWC